MSDPLPAAPRSLDRQFRWRGTSVTRLEALSDSVFAIVLGLLFLRTVPPDSFTDLKAAMKSMVPFAACFAIVAYVWIEHWLFSRRYDLQDGWIQLLQLVLLFLLLCYAYPLKYLFTFLAVLLLGPIGDSNLERLTAGHAGAGDSVQLFAFYGLGYGLMFVVLGLMYWRALAFAGALGLDRTERFLTRAAVVGCLLQVGVAALSIVLAVLGVGLHYGLPGWVYCLLGPVMAMHGVWQGRGVERLQVAA